MVKLTFNHSCLSLHNSSSFMWIVSLKLRADVHPEWNFPPTPYHLVLYGLYYGLRISRRDGRGCLGQRDAAPRRVG